MKNEYKKCNIAPRVQYCPVIFFLSVIVKLQTAHTHTEQNIIIFTYVQQTSPSKNCHIPLCVFVYSMAGSDLLKGNCPLLRNMFRSAENRECKLAIYENNTSQQKHLHFIIYGAKKSAILALTVALCALCLGSKTYYEINCCLVYSIKHLFWIKTIKDGAGMRSTPETVSVGIV